MSHSLLLLVCIISLVPLVYSFGIQVEPKSSECFSASFPKHRQIKLNWQVTRGGLLDVNVQVRFDGDPTAPLATPQMLYEKLYFEKDHAPGQVCFSFLTCVIFVIQLQFSCFDLV